MPLTDGHHRYCLAMPRESHYETQHSTFSFIGRPEQPAWRNPQLGAISAVIAHWTLSPVERLLVSMPTGSGKTGVATALPYLARAHRVLVVVPSTELRSQLAANFRSEDVLRRIGAVTASFRPIVEELKGRSIDWSALETADVVVALPNSISPSHFAEGEAPPSGFFDLIIIDEAHHSPAKTWQSILEHYPDARAVLLTATPRRTDGKPLPGTHAFHYPLRLAMADGIYQRIEPRILAAGPQSTIDSRDAAIAVEVVAAANRPEHANSAILIRAKSVLRAEKLKTLYATHGLASEILTNGVGETDRRRIIDAWRDESLRAVITVDMLAEGFDLPSLRIVGYHDKHKSVPATMQFIGRLARASGSHPQESVLVTVHDEDVYPALQGALRELYKEDADWAEVLPELIDEPVRARRLDAEYLSEFPESPANISLTAINPLARAVLYEAPEGGGWVPSFTLGAVPEELEVGAVFAAQTVVYSGLNAASTQLVVLTRRLETPSWYINDDGLTRPVFDLHVVSWHQRPQTDRRDLLFINSQDKRVMSALMKLLDPTSQLRNSNPAFLQDAFDSLERISVSSVGVRNTYAGTAGTPSYAMFAGSGIERGISEADTNSRALGHAMAQVEAAASGRPVTAGMAAGKSKYWETRYLGLREYEAFSTELASRYWFPRSTMSGPLLPNVARAMRTEEFPSVEAIQAEFSPSILNRGWTLTDGRPIETLELQIDPARPATVDHVHLRVIDRRDESNTIWEGAQDVTGRFTTHFESAAARRMSGVESALGDLLTINPPTIYFLDGTTAAGGVTYHPSNVETFFPDAINFLPWEWTGIDIQRETKRAGRHDSIHDAVESRLLAHPSPSDRRRWVLFNDGGGEIADHLVIEISTVGRVRLEMWHSKAASGPAPGARQTDMQVVAQQASKSRRHITDRDLWHRIGRRLTGEESPAIHVLGGDRAGLLAPWSPAGWWSFGPAAS
ncbi:DEAD/DEAH box helicase family protein [Microbacterium sp. 5K110]|uniref:DEAD/DEAH box helicase n=1 Tax=Microbacterium sp. 5K110 TaxID=2578104 RepID=UPI0010FD8C08|nr:DEAD/DEAH box helicase family protein [Microbacterium sp. 5K110]TLF33778.1 DEAD/DEAH box helicase [Microbacterium sp. 5K110]